MIVDDGTGVGRALAARLAERGHRVARIVSGDADHGPDTIRADLDSYEGATRAVEELASRYERASALVHLAALGHDQGPDVAKGLFPLAQLLSDDLTAAAAAGGAAIVGATRMGGAFGVDARPAEFDHWHGLVTGFLKSLAQEITSARVRAVDLAPCAPDTAADQLLAEIFSDDASVEIGYRDGVRTTLELTPSPFVAADSDSPVDRDSVILVTGGARGITAEVALRLAERYQPILVLLGRTDPDDESMTDQVTDRDLKRAIFERWKAEGSEITVAAVEAEFSRIVNAREVRETLARLRAAGARVTYLRCDVRDGASLARAVDEVYGTYGRIDGVIHGAGVIEDKLVRDKKADSFARVVATKAVGAQHLVDALRPETLRFVVFFSSVSGRFGNRGQADYAAASEVLNKLAAQLDDRWGARVVSINWGPWATGGMMTPEVQRQFAARGVELIPVHTGCEMLDEELRHGAKGSAEVVVGGAASSPPEAIPAVLDVGGLVVRRSAGGVELVRTLDVRRDLYLRDHCLDGRPVLPFAVAMELMAAAAATARPELRFEGLRDIRLNQGVVVESETTVNLLAEPVNAEPGRAGASFDVKLVADARRPSYTCTVQLGRADGEAGAAWPAALSVPTAFPLSVDEIYDRYLFHGPLFQRIAVIEGVTEHGVTTLLRPSTPAECLDGAPPGRTWLVDPCMVDAALQVQVLWARHYWGVTLLPARIGGYCRVAAMPPGVDIVQHELRVRAPATPPLCIADHWFSANGVLLATLTAVEGVGSKALNRLATA